MVAADGFALLGGVASSPALLEPDGAVVPYAQLADDVDQAATVLAEIGGPVVVLCDNSRAAVTAYLAGMCSGSATVLVGSAQDELLRRVILEYRPTAILGSLAAFSSVHVEAAGEAQVAQRLAGAVHLLHLPGGAGLPGGQTGLLLATSGSTASPKFVRLSLQSVVANARSIVEALAIDAEEIAPTSLPIEYSYGLSVLNSHLLSGACVAVTDHSVVDKRFWALMADRNCTSFAGVPYSYQMLRRLRMLNALPVSVRTLTQAGGRLDPDSQQTLFDVMVARGGEFFTMYGQTEATARMAVLPHERFAEKRGSVGRPIPGGAFSIDRIDGERDHDGEIVFTGPNVMLGYAESLVDLHGPDELGGVLRTGDLGYVDDDGFVFVTGRLKRIAKVFGVRVSLDDVEARLAEFGPSLAVSHDDGLRVLCEWGSPEEIAAARSALAAKLGVHHSGVCLERVAELPRLPNGKLDYARATDAG